MAVCRKSATSDSYSERPSPRMTLTCRLTSRWVNPCRNARIGQYSALSCALTSQSRSGLDASCAWSRKAWSRSCSLSPLSGWPSLSRQAAAAHKGCWPAARPPRRPSAWPGRRSRGPSGPSSSTSARRRPPGPGRDPAPGRPAGRRGRHRPGGPPAVPAEGQPGRLRPGPGGAGDPAGPALTVPFRDAVAAGDIQRPRWRAVVATETAVRMPGRPWRWRPRPGR